MNSNARAENRGEALAVSQADLKTLEMWISRYRCVLYFVAYRVLGNHTDAEEAVQSCMLSIRRNVPSLEHEGGFRASLVRVLINEALALLPKNGIKSATSNCFDHHPDPGAYAQRVIGQFRSLLRGSPCGLLLVDRNLEQSGWNTFGGGRPYDF
jgi:DNA-directed RNA polymerase specialized sigma24 family protein